MEKLKKIEEIKKYGKKSKGRRLLLSYLEGNRLTPKQAILAKCYECSNYYIDGFVECNIKDCPLYPHSPFRKKQ